MDVISDLIDGTVEVTNGTAEIAGEKISAAVQLIGLGLVLIAILILAFIDPLTAIVVTIAAVAGLIFLRSR